MTDRAVEELADYRVWDDTIFHRRPGSDLLWVRRYESWTEGGVRYGCWHWVLVQEAKR